MDKPKMDKPKRKRNYTREAILEALRYAESVRAGIWEVVGGEVLNGEDKTRLHHFNRGMNFVLRAVRTRLQRQVRHGD